MLQLHQALSGCVVNVSSVASTKIVTDMIGYIMSKGALDSLTKASALELAPMRIRVNSIKPGTVRTNLLTTTWEPHALAEVSRL